MGALATPAAHADSVLGVELSPAICKLNPYMGNLRQCIEGNPMTVNFYRVANQSCSNSRYSMSPLQENLTSKVIPDGNIRKNIWQQYGRCSGLSTPNYFRTITSLASQLKLPKELSSGRSYRFASNGLSRQLISLNPGMKPNSFNFFCQKNSAGQSVLTYINVCYDNNGRFAQCATRSYTCPSQFLIDGNY
jgi:ribonuclease I